MMRVALSWALIYWRRFLHWISPNEDAEVFRQLLKRPEPAPANGQSICDLLQATPQHGSRVWEKCCLSAFSPGPLADREWMRRMIFAPHHINPTTGLPKPNILDDAFGMGASVDRSCYANLGDTHRRGRMKAARDKEKGKDRSYPGCLLLSAKELRAVAKSQGGAKLLTLYDTALHDFVSHADIFAVDSSKQAKQEVRAFVDSLVRERHARRWCSSGSGIE